MAYPNGEERQPVARPTAAAMPDQRLSKTQHQPQNTSDAKPNGSVSFQKAVKRDAKLRFAVCGPSGSGKTYTLLKLATELGGVARTTLRGRPCVYATQWHGSEAAWRSMCALPLAAGGAYPSPEVPLPRRYPPGGEPRAGVLGLPPAHS